MPGASPPGKSGAPGLAPSKRSSANERSRILVSMEHLVLCRRLLRPVLISLTIMFSQLFAAHAEATVYDAELSEQLMHGPDLCAAAPCGDVMPTAKQFSTRKGAPSYVEAYAVDGDKRRLVGYVFLSTDVVDIPAYSGKPVVTLIGMDIQGIITGVRVLKHSEPILLAGIPESALLKFIDQYVGKAATSKLIIGRDREDEAAIGLDAISGATVTAIAENQVISRSAYEIGKAGWHHQEHPQAGRAFHRGQG